MRWPGPLIRASFVMRENRFHARALMNGKGVDCHVPNTSHLRDFLEPGATVFLMAAAGSGRKLSFEMVAVETPSGLVSVDTKVPNRLFAEGLRAGTFKDFGRGAELETEVWVDGSRMDFAVSPPQSIIEVKSCMLARDGVGWFPDPASERATRHMGELARAARRGIRAFVYFFVQRMDVGALSANDTVDPGFGRSFRTALKAGVIARACRCRVTLDEVIIESSVRILV